MPDAGSIRSWSPVRKSWVTAPSKRSTRAKPPKGCTLGDDRIDPVEDQPRGTMPRAFISWSIQAVVTPPLAVSRTRMRST
jgi:hypothetical protein